MPGRILLNYLDTPIMDHTIVALTLIKRLSPANSVLSACQQLTRWRSCPLR